MKVQIKHQGLLIAPVVRQADNFVTRLLGYMFSSRPTMDDGILFDPGKSIHTFFMFFSLDVVFMKKDGTVIKIFRNLRPWRMTWIYPSAQFALELPAGKLPLTVKEGDKLEVGHV